MSQPTNLRSPETPDDPRKIGNWARTYAQNRSLGVVVFLVLFLVLSTALGGSSYLGGVAYRNGQWLIFWGCMIIEAISFAAVGYFSVPRWGGRLIERLIERLYAGEGGVQLAPPTRGRFWLMVIVSAACGVCYAAEIVLCQLHEIPDKYMQPISAIYVVPILVAMVWLSRPVVGPIALLWPALYALHAILIFAGVPIFFVGAWASLNWLIPTFGYALLVALGGHIYSRFALRKLQRIARGGMQDGTTEEPQP